MERLREIGNFEVEWHGGRIRSLKFSDEAKSLKTAKEWRNIPNFCVLTGPNGSGKSHLLEYINRTFLYSKDGVSYHGHYIYLPAHESEHLSGSTRLDIDRLGLISAWNEISTWSEDEPGERIDEKINRLREKFTQEIMIFHDGNKIKAEKFFNNLKSILDENDETTQLHKFVFLFQSYFPNLVSGDRPIDVLTHIFQNYSTREAKSKLKVSPNLNPSLFEEINKILRKYKFNFEIRVSENKNEDPHFWFIKTNVEGESPKIEYWELSSGEKKILEILAWFYYYSPEKTSDEQKVNIMLLDEADRHLDPEFLVLFLQIIYEELVKTKNVQVIMTTHRPDTINLVPEESIFLLDRKTDGSEIVHASRNQVLRRLTQNLQNYTRTSTKVYTEGTTDADFYCGAYYSLLDCSSKQMSMNQKELIFKGNENKKITKSLLSREYPLLFISSGISRYNPGDEGGVSQVIACVKRDQSILLNKSKEKQDKIEPISDPQAYNSFGFIDHDHGQNSETLKANDLLKRIAIPKVRYSIENFVLDPIILCQALTPEQASGYVNSFIEKEQLQSSNGVIEGTKASEAKDSIMKPAQAQTQSCNTENAKGTQIPETETSVPTKKDKVLEKKNLFTEICRKVRGELDTIINQLKEDGHSNISSQKLQSYLDEYFNFFDRACDIYENKLNNEPQKNEKKLNKDSQKKDNLTDKEKSIQTCMKMQGEIEKLKASGADIQSIESLSNMLSSLIQTLSKPKNKGGKKGKGKGSNPEKIEEPMKKLPEGNFKVKIFLLKGFNRFITLQYPIKFLKIRGHDLVYGITPKPKEVAKPIEAITNYVYTNGLTFIQEELIDVIIDLNNFARGKEPEEEELKDEEPKDEEPEDEKPENMGPEYEDENLFI